MEDLAASTKQELPIVAVVVRQHAEDAAVLHSIRTALTAAAQIKLKDLRRFDDRVAAHLDGLSVAGEQAWPLLDAALAPPSPGTLFAATVMAIENRSADRLRHLYALAEAVPEAQRGLVSGFGWVEQPQLRGLVVNLLGSQSTFQRLLAMKVCAMHRVDTGRLGDVITKESEPRLAGRALRAAGELGEVDLIPTCLRMLTEDDAECRFWAAWSGVLLGNRGAAVETLETLVEEPGPLSSRAFRLALQAADQIRAQAWMRRLARDPDNLRLLINGSGICGDPYYVPWLIKHMIDPKTARLAGEAFSLITGVDLAFQHLDRKAPEDIDAGPNDEPSDDNVDMGQDHGLLWPDPDRVAEWWQANGGRFDAGTRYFVGAPVIRENCLRVLKEGFQRQRILAAHYLCLLEPGTTLFEWRAPAARQQRLLAAMV